ncbi:MAG: MarC family protein [Chlorobi bacterium]|nr:MarC family protein [Chlorobiota bacterium]
MSDILTYTLTVFTGFFAIMNPIANTPIFVGLVQGSSPGEKKKIAKNATVTAFLIVFAFIIIGKYIFDIFGITIPAFKITGGILIFWVGFKMLQSEKSKMHHIEGGEIDDSLAISPLAIPILAGPGTIVTAMNDVAGQDYLHIAITIGVFGVMILLTYWAFSISEKIISFIGNNMITVIAKLMGLILAIIGVNMVIDGIKLAFNLK